MRHESSVTSISWIPSEAVTGPMNKAVFNSGVTHFDDPPPDHIEDLEALREADAFRFANRLAAWIDVEDGRIVDAGHAGGGAMGSTSVRIGSRGATFAGVSFPDLRNEPAIEPTQVRFVQTVGGHTALPLPRRVRHAPFVKMEAPTVWTTLALTMHADGRSEHAVVGASAFPRHWIYDESDQLCAKVGVADFKEWTRTAFGRHTPWGDVDSPALVTTVETALERELAARIMRSGTKPRIRTLDAGELLTEQGAEGTEVFLLLDGVVTIEVDGVVLADIGPGAVLGERATLEGGRRSATLRARTAVKVCIADADQLDPAVLSDISLTHDREHA